MIWRLTERKDWDSLVQQFSWVRDMDLVPQHALHHAEGSVAVHTRMVLEALQQQPSYLRLAEQDREILWAAALLHDVEKRSTSVDEGNGQITSKNHAKRGGSYCTHPPLQGYFYAFRYSRAYCLSGTPSWFAYLADGTGRSLETCL